MGVLGEFLDPTCLPARPGLSQLQSKHLPYQIRSYLRVIVFTPQRAKGRGLRVDQSLKVQLPLHLHTQDQAAALGRRASWEAL